MQVDWSQYVAVNSATAHPHYDREGATYNMGNSYGKGGNLHSLLASRLSTCVTTHVCIYVNVLMRSILTNTVTTLSGYFYNIIRVPPPEEKAATADSADLNGAKVICSIRAQEPRKPSYFHSFGETHTTVQQTCHSFFK